MRTFEYFFTVSGCDLDVALERNIMHISNYRSVYPCLVCLDTVISDSDLPSLPHFSTFLFQNVQLTIDFPFELFISCQLFSVLVKGVFRHYSMLLKFTLHYNLLIMSLCRSEGNL